MANKLRTQKNVTQFHGMKLYYNNFCIIEEVDQFTQYVYGT